ncbi:gamma-glutamylcyclotransferase family protein [Mucilaginibacter sp.]|uniref:gamma-glutamylcyclotransferase family protein n=1 Tax=Mucilaginibacter sp. TaxID=1882438 RepID=UPI000CB57C5D|nr:gamma-glutamylcyclotransferase family protein [Mucilaginibacter sp.]PLW88477.1 MAG: hypothetical protein C0154_16250 [Mucilaginibacter sp.]PMP66182.1 MAG: hypothetical protein C0191_01220 [Mucilaginibacter sp.]HEK21010.1 gamma-glutamylcyclotransferase [Bacteroidota bacterium]
MTRLLFVYGTLLQADNEFARYLRQKCTFVSTGVIHGQLYDLGEYPGLIITSDANQLVHGNIYEMTHSEEVLKRLDFYEGVGTDEEQPNLYRREMHTVTIDNDTLEAWIYIYNRSIDNAIAIPGGNYLEYVNKKSPGK